MRRSKVVFITLILLLFIAAAYAWTPPGDISLRSYYNIINGVWINGTDIYASSHFHGNGSLLTDITGAGNTTAQVRSAVNASVTYLFTAAKAFFIDNSTERTLFTKTYNSSYDAHMTSNYSAQTDYIGNSTERTHFEKTYNSSYDAYITANVSSESDTLDGYDSGYFYPKNKTMVNATKFADNVKLVFGTGDDFLIYFNGSHLLIEP